MIVSRNSVERQVRKKVMNCLKKMIFFKIQMQIWMVIIIILTNLILEGVANLKKS